MAEVKPAELSRAPAVVDLVEELPGPQTSYSGTQHIANESLVPAIPDYYTRPPVLRDSLETESSRVQDEVHNTSLPFLKGNPNHTPLNTKGIQQLQRENHIEFLRDALEDYPEQFAAMDASRPWIFYWALAGLSMLGVDVQEYRDRLVYTTRTCQSPTGGYGGGHGQLAHICSSYAIVLALAIVGEEDAYDSIDRKGMWRFLSSMKQPDGGFTVAAGAEEDIRGAYCAMTIITLLNLPLELAPGSPARINGDETFLTNLPEWVASCQTFEGGIGASPGNEAHGAYAFCAMGCLSIIGAPSDTIPRYLDTEALTRWLSSQQRAPEGGFAGRTNKLVDGCYSHWVGGCWSLLGAAISHDTTLAPSEGLNRQLWSRNGLARWILGCCQGKHGGLRDKPRKPPDSYHSCYILAGLCAVQYHYRYGSDSISDLTTSQLSAPFGWTVDEASEGGVLYTAGSTHDDAWCWDENDLLKPVHPVFVIPLGRSERIRAYFEQKLGF